MTGLREHGVFPVEPRLATPIGSLAEAGSLLDERQSLKVFISYARSDAADFAQELLHGLEVAGFEPFLDRHDIAAGEDWEERLGGLIAAADTVVFVVTPAAVASKRCAWEIRQAETLAKRIIPVVAIDVPEAQTPESLKRLNYIFFTKGHSFTRALGDLARALRVDLHWIREHTRLAEFAARWRDRDNAEALLLREAALEEARSWLTGWRAGAPEPTDLHRSFIAASEQAEERHFEIERARLEEMEAAQVAREEALHRLSRRTTVGLIGAGALTVASGGLAYWGLDAERRFGREQQLREDAQRNSIDAAIRREAMRRDVSGQLVAYAASPGDIAADGPQGGNSPYTVAVLRELANPETSLQAALARSHQQVARTSTTRQRPFVSTSLNADLYLKHPSPSRRLTAMTISTDRYSRTRMPNTPRDAALWRRFLAAAGFDVVALTNPTLAQARQALDRLSFQEEAADDGPSPPADTLIALFYAGAGVTHEGQNYLTMVSSGFATRLEIANTMLDVSLIENVLKQRAAASVIVLDTNFSDFETARAWDSSS